MDGSSFNSAPNGGRRNILGVVVAGSSSSPVVRNQSSMVNDLLQVDEKHFLNEIVKNFNKSIVMNSFEFSPAGTMATNESGTNTSNTNHLPRAAVMSVGAPSSSSSLAFATTTETTSLMRTHTRTTSGSVGVGSAAGSRNAVPSGSKIHYHKSDSAMLNHIFDSHVKHRHSDLRSVE